MWSLKSRSMGSLKHRCSVSLLHKTLTANSPPLFLLLRGLSIQSNVFSCMDKHCEPRQSLYGRCALTL